MKPLFIALLRGLGDVATSAGIDTLAAKLRVKYPYAHVIVYNWYDWQHTITDMRAQPPGTTFVVIGYSMGANETTGISDAGLPIKLLVAMDPTIWDTVSPLHGNVAKALLFHDVNPLNPVGHAVLTAGEGFDPHNLTVITIWNWHLNVDTDVQVQAHTLSAIEVAVGA